MRQKRWLVIGSAAIVLATGVALGLGNSSSADEPVRVYLVHGASAPERGSSQWGIGGGITIYTGGSRAITWPTQVVGYLHDIEDDWVVLRKAEGKERLEIHIPRERVQLIEHISEDALEALLTGR